MTTLHPFFTQMAAPQRTETKTEQTKTQHPFFTMKRKTADSMDFEELLHATKKVHSAMKYVILHELEGSEETAWFKLHDLAEYLGDLAYELKEMTWRGHEDANWGNMRPLGSVLAEKLGKEQTETKTLTISFTLPLVSLAEATKTSPEWLIEHQEILSDYMRGYWVFEDELDNSHTEMLTQAVEEVKRGSEK